MRQGEEDESEHYLLKSSVLSIAGDNSLVAIFSKSNAGTEQLRVEAAESRLLLLHRGANEPFKSTVSVGIKRSGRSSCTSARRDHRRPLDACDP